MPGRERSGRVSLKTGNKVKDAKSHEIYRKTNTVFPFLKLDMDAWCFTKDGRGIAIGPWLRGYVFELVLGSDGFRSDSLN